MCISWTNAKIEEIDHNDDNSNYFELLQTSLRLHDVA